MITMNVLPGVPGDGVRKPKRKKYDRHKRGAAKLTPKRVKARIRTTMEQFLEVDEWPNDEQFLRM